jgi:hypothetical protein
MTRSPLTIKPYVIRYYLVAFLAFVLIKAIVRPWVLGLNVWIGFDIFVLSFPNFVEAIVGMSTSYGLLLLAKHREWLGIERASATLLLVVATTFTAVYVLTQEFGVHNLGGNNVPDLYDAAASVLGIILTVFLFGQYGFYRET